MTRTALSLLLYTAILLGLCVYSATIGPRHVVSIREALADPAAFAGRKLNLQYARVVSVLPWVLQVAGHSTRITVQVPASLEPAWDVWKSQVQARDYVSLQAVLHPNGLLILRDLHVHEGRWLKIWVSVFALVLVAGIIIYERRKACCHRA
jgi:hypothetical protein